MKHILIPTDFSIDSLNTVHAAIANYGEEKLKITLFHLLTMSSDISELMFPSMRNKHHQMISDDFHEACEILQNRYHSKVHSLRIKFGFGDTVSYLRNFIEGAKVDLIVVGQGVPLSLPSSRSVKMMPILERTGFPIEIIPSKNIAQHYADMKAINMLPPNEMKVPKPDKKYATKI